MRSNYNLESTINTQPNKSQKAALWEELEDEAAESMRGGVIIIIGFQQKPTKFLGDFKTAKSRFKID